MSTKIEWSESTISFLTGCRHVSEGCRACYAAQLTATRLAHTEKYAGLAHMKQGRGVFTGEVKFWPDQLDKLLRMRKGRLFFVNSMSDTFHEAVQDEWLDRMFATFAATPQHRYMLLTKRSQRMVGYSECREEMANEGSGIWPLPNVACGVSCETQDYISRIDDLCDTPAALRYVSVEPMLGPINLWEMGYSTIGTPTEAKFPDVDQIIIGCESHGPHLGRLSVDGKATPDTWLGWATDLADQCHASGVRLFVKQIPSPDGQLLHSRTVLDHPDHPELRHWPQALRSWQMLPWEDHHA